jgi:hypothetical protein
MSRLVEDNFARRFKTPAERAILPTFPNLLRVGAQEEKPFVQV